MEVRKANRSDLIGVERVVHIALWEAYNGLLQPSTISETLTTSYAPSELKRRLLEGALLVAADQQRIVVGFAIFDRDADRVDVQALAIDPEHRRRGIGRRLLAAVREQAGEVPLTMRILLGSLEGEQFAEAEGFVPGEIIERELYGEPVVERRWWHSVA